MRDFLDAILTAIDSESLTDEEFDGMTLPDTPAYTKEIYEAMKLVLEARESVSGQVERLKFYFIARGADLSASPGARAPQSQIYIGDSLE